MLKNKLREVVRYKIFSYSFFHKKKKKKKKSLGWGKIFHKKQRRMENTSTYKNKNEMENISLHPSTYFSTSHTNQLFFSIIFHLVIKQNLIIAILVFDIIKKRGKQNKLSCPVASLKHGSQFLSLHRLQLILVVKNLLLYKTVSGSKKKKWNIWKEMQRVVWRRAEVMLLCFPTIITLEGSAERGHQNRGMKRLIFILLL